MSLTHPVLADHKACAPCAWRALTRKSRIETRCIQRLLSTATMLADVSDPRHLPLIGACDHGFGGCSQDLANKKKIGQQRAEMAGGVQVID